MIARHWLAAKVALVALVFAGGSFAQQQAEALKLITEAAKEICGIIATTGGLTTVKGSAEAKASLGTLAKRLTDLGFSGKVEVVDESYTGLAREDLPTAIQKSADCKERVFQTLQAKMITGAQHYVPVGDSKQVFLLAEGRQKEINLLQLTTAAQDVARNPGRKLQVILEKTSAQKAMFPGTAGGADLERNDARVAEVKANLKATGLRDDQQEFIFTETASKFPRTDPIVVRVMKLE